MSEAPCHHREAYLARDLAEPERTAFMRHLPSCETCRQIVADEARLDDLLGRATSHLQPVPVGLTERIEHRLRVRRRLRWAGGVMGVAAAAILAWVALAMLRSPLPAPPPEAPRVPEIVERPNLPPPVPIDSQPVDVRFAPDAPVIAVPAQTDDPDVTLIWVYPTLSVRADNDSPEEERNQ